jgi:hypothetical protein
MIDLNKLDTMNYTVTTPSGSYDMVCGLESLSNFACHHCIDLQELGLALCSKGYYVIEEKSIQISMI